MRIFLASSSEASFVNRDVEILRHKHQVSFHHLRHFNPLRWLADLPQLLGSRVIFFWFASLYNLPYLLAAVFFGKRIITVVGGYEAADRPEINYGAARGGLRTSLTRLMLGVSHLVLTVSESSRQDVLNNLGVNAEKCLLLPHGFADVAAGERFSKRQQVATIATLDRSTWEVKGLRAFCEVAEKIPGAKFLLIGGQRMAPEKLWGRALPHNVVLVGRVPYAEIAQHLADAKVYLQLSRAESFGCAVAEAMLCSAIPVVSAAGALPQVVGECGYVVPGDDLVAAVDAVKRALAAPAEEGAAARERVLREFSLETRQQGLLEVIARFERRPVAASRSPRR